MKRIWMAVMALALSASLSLGATLKVRVVEQGTQNVVYTTSGPQTVNLEIQAALDGTEGSGTPTSDGLAGISLDLQASAAGTTAPDLCDTSAFALASGSSMHTFDRSEGLTNPSNSPNFTGFSGTCEAGSLLQIGGGQNTVGNQPGEAPYPIGPVVADIGNLGWEVIATGSINVDLQNGESIFLTPESVLANTIDNFIAGSPFAVTEVTNVVVEGLEIRGEVFCSSFDVNCSGEVDIADIRIVIRPDNFDQSPPACDRADVNSDGIADVADLALISSPANFGTTTGPCICSTETPLQCQQFTAAPVRKPIKVVRRSDLRVKAKHLAEAPAQSPSTCLPEPPWPSCTQYCSNLFTCDMFGPIEQPIGLCWWDGKQYGGANEILTGPNWLGWPENPRKDYIYCSTITTDVPNLPSIGYSHLVECPWMCLTTWCQTHECVDHQGNPFTPGPCCLSDCLDIVSVVGDFDGDGDADLADYLVYQRIIGSGLTPLYPCY